MMGAITNHQFVIGMLTLRDVLAVTKTVATSLQAVNKDLRCVAEVRVCIAVLKKKRDEPHEIMIEIACDADNLLKEDLRMPRISSQQINSPNIEANNLKEYYTRSLLIPFLDGVISNLNDRFSHHAETAMRMSALVPAFLNEQTFNEVSLRIFADIFCMPCIVGTGWRQRLYFQYRGCGGAHL